MVRTFALQLCLALVCAQGRLLRRDDPPADDASADLSVDDQIEALQNQISGAVTNVATAQTEAMKSGMSEDEVMKNSIETFDKHCKPEEKAKLEKDDDEETKNKATADDSSFADSLEASNRQSLIKNEEFLLGLMTMHQSRGDWLPQQFLDAVCTLANDSPLIKKLYKHHDPNKPLALQFAMMMDEERKTMAPTKAPPMEEGPNALANILSRLGVGSLVAKAISAPPADASKGLLAAGKPSKAAAGQAAAAPVKR